MRTTRKILTATAAAVGVAVAAMPLLAEAETGALQWGDCSDNPALQAEYPDGLPDDIECATLEVPIDVGSGDRTIDIQVSRLGHTGTQSPKGSVVLIPGGPGGPGSTDLVAYQDSFTALREHFNVVSFDPRGNWYDTDLPDNCSLDGPEYDAPKDRAEFDTVHARHRTLLEECRSADPELFDSLHSLSHARDLEALRSALDEGPLNALANSYGGTIAGSYARQFPDQVRTMFLDSVVENVTPRDDAHAKDLTHLESLFDEFTDWCATEADCALSGQDIPELWQRLVEQADESPIPVSEMDDVSFDGHDLQAHAAILVKSDQHWPLLADGIADARAGDASTIATPSLGSGRKAFAPSTSVAVECGDGNGFADYGEYSASRDRDRELSPNFSEQRVNRSMFCVDWPVPVANPRAPLPGLELPPLFGVDDIGDPPDARIMAEQVPGSAAVKYDGYGHGLYINLAVPCVIEYADRYFIEAAIPDGDLDCQVPAK